MFNEMYIEEVIMLKKGRKYGISAQLQVHSVNLSLNTLGNVKFQENEMCVDIKNSGTLKKNLDYSGTKEGHSSFQRTVDSWSI